MSFISENLPLVIFEMANNHMGTVDHGIRVIREFADIKRRFPGFKFGFKMQYRQIDTFIHPDYTNRMDIKYVKRFSETRLPLNGLYRMKEEMNAHGFVTICTPFDNDSVDVILNHDYDIIKIASCSFTDWPLLERIALTDKPIIASTAGISLDDIDRVVAFFLNRGKDLALMHCVAEYPTPDDQLRLGRLDVLMDRYPGVPVGYSTHERPEAVVPVAMALAKGAQLLEKHVAVPTEEYGINAYSATPAQTEKWLEAAAKAMIFNGKPEGHFTFRDGETESLRSLRRGMFAKRLIKAGEVVGPEDVFFAIPVIGDQITANEFSKYSEYLVKADIPANAAVNHANLEITENREKIFTIVRQANKFLQMSCVPVPPKVDLEISHHYGIDDFYQHGLVMFTVVNREYCKKIIMMLPGQIHPEQYHNEKEETFHILYGSIDLQLDGVLKHCKVGDVVTIEPGVRHAFQTTTGVVLEEISSTHVIEDSFYTDTAIMENKNRKTKLTYWWNVF